MWMSKTSRYALQAATYLAEHSEAAVQVREIAEHTGVPRNYLAKILHQLARQGVLRSERGSRGGFRLAMDPADIPLAAVIEPVDPSLSDQQCLLGRPTCSDTDPCLAHQGWKTLSEDLRRFLDETSLADLVKRE
jgi:Rrf2 family protein